MAATPVVHPLLLGDLDDCFDDDFLSHQNVRTVFNMCGTNCSNSYACLNRHLAAKDISHFIVPMDDSAEFDLMTCFSDRKVLEFLLSSHSVGGVLVVCWGGCNRSAAVVVAYLIRFCNFKVVDAFKLCQDRRGTVLTNLSFRRQLVQLYLSLNRA